MQKVSAIFCPRVGSKDSGTWLFQPPFGFFNHLLAFSSTFWHLQAPFGFFNHLLAPIMGVFGYYGAARASIQLICALALTPTHPPASFAHEIFLSRRSLMWGTTKAQLLLFTDTYGHCTTLYWTYDPALFATINIIFVANLANLFLLQGYFDFEGTALY